MPPTKSDFQNLATRLFTKTFGDFPHDLTFTFDSSETYDPVTGTYSGGASQYTIPCIILDYMSSQYDGDKIRIGDKKLLSRVASWTIFGVIPKVDSCTVNIDGIQHQITFANKDAADAVYTINVRSL